MSTPNNDPIVEQVEAESVEAPVVNVVISDVIGLPTSPEANVSNAQRGGAGGGAHAGRRF